MHLGQEEDFLTSFDVEKFKTILKSSWILLIVFFVIAVTCAFVYLRYTKPIYESSSVIKLDFESEASVLDISNPIDRQEGDS